VLHKTLAVLHKEDRAPIRRCGLIGLERACAPVTKWKSSFTHGIATNGRF